MRELFYIAGAFQIAYQAGYLFYLCIPTYSPGKQFGDKPFVIALRIFPFENVVFRMAGQTYHLALVFASLYSEKFFTKLQLLSLAALIV